MIQSERRWTPTTRRIKINLHIDEKEMETLLLVNFTCTCDARTVMVLGAQSHAYALNLNRFCMQNCFHFVWQQERAYAPPPPLLGFNGNTSESNKQHSIHYHNKRYTDEMEKQIPKWEEKYKSVDWGLWLYTHTHTHTKYARSERTLSAASMCFPFVCILHSAVRRPDSAGWYTIPPKLTISMVSSFVAIGLKSLAILQSNLFSNCCCCCGDIILFSRLICIWVTFRVDSFALSTFVRSFVPSITR